MQFLWISLSNSCRDPWWVARLHARVFREVSGQCVEVCCGCVASVLYVHSLFFVLFSSLCILYSAFCILHSAFCCLHSAFCIPDCVLCICILYAAACLPTCPSSSRCRLHTSVLSSIRDSTSPKDSYIISPWKNAVLSTCSTNAAVAVAFVPLQSMDSVASLSI